MGRRAACASMIGIAKGTVLPVTHGFPIARGAQALWLLVRIFVSLARGKEKKSIQGWLSPFSPSREKSLLST